MTDPNPLKQAAEEAKARKLAEVDARKAQMEKLTETNATRLREEVFERFELIEFKPSVQSPSGTLDDLIREQGLSFTMGGDRRAILTSIVLNTPPTVADLAIVIPKQRLNITELLGALASEGLQQADLRQLCSCGTRAELPEYEYLFARIREPIMGRAFLPALQYSVSSGPWDAGAIYAHLDDNDRTDPRFTFNRKTAILVQVSAEVRDRIRAKQQELLPNQPTP
jgi:hypothetical protein